MVTLAFETTGPAEGRPLVLLHAFPLGRAMWRPVASLLNDVRCVLVDLPGLGESPLPDGAANLEMSGAGVIGVLDELGVDRAVVAGVSMGGYVLLGLLRDHPQRVAGAALVDTKVEADPDAARENRIRMAQAVLGDAGRRALAPLNETLIGATSRQTRPEVVSALSGWLAETPLSGVAWSQRAMAARPETAAVLGAVSVPVAIVVGEEDVFTPPSAAQAMAELAPDATLRVVAGAGHLSPLEAPADVAAALRDLIARVG